MRIGGDKENVMDFIEIMDWFSLSILASLREAKRSFRVLDLRGGHHGESRIQKPRKIRFREERDR
jgi:hypothetical protein